VGGGQPWIEFDRFLELYNRFVGAAEILEHLAEWLPRSGGPRAIYFDLQDKAAWPVGKIMVHLAETIADELGLATPEPGPEPETWFRETWLPPVLAGLPPGQALAVLFDEAGEARLVFTRRSTALRTSRGSCWRATRPRPSTRR